MNEQTLLRTTVERSLYANYAIQSRDVAKVLLNRIPRPSDVRKGFDFIRVWLARGYLTQVNKNDYLITDAGKAWCGLGGAAMNVTNTA